MSELAKRKMLAIMVLTNGQPIWRAFAIRCVGDQDSHAIHHPQHRLGRLLGLRVPIFKLEQAMFDNYANDRAAKNSITGTTPTIPTFSPGR